MAQRRTHRSITRTAKHAAFSAHAPHIPQASTLRLATAFRASPQNFALLCGLRLSSLPHFNRAGGSNPAPGVLFTGAGVSLCPGSSSWPQLIPRAAPHAGLRFNPACATRSRQALHNQITPAHATSQPPTPRPCYSSTISPPQNRPAANQPPPNNQPHMAFASSKPNQTPLPHFYRKIPQKGRCWLLHAICAESANRSCQHLPR